ncbi:VOC family protein [Sinosporangium siamense]|uniref:VOC family protein n=1 Tax=Sinosporangium siamense TaxID=1367973 RepID=UPI0035A24320
MVGIAHQCGSARPAAAIRLVRSARLPPRRDDHATFAKAREFGAEVLEEPADPPWGPRGRALRDPSGNLVRDLGNRDPLRRAVPSKDAAHAWDAADRTCEREADHQ